MKHLIFGAALSILPLILPAQNLMDLLEEETVPETLFVEQTFKGTRVVNGHSVETRDRGVLDVLISHRFGRLNTGAYELFGLDDSNIRIGADWGVTDRFNIGVGRNSFEKTFDGFLKYKLFRQQMAGTPISVVAFGSLALQTLKTGNPGGEPSAGDRLTHTYQLMVARKFGPAFSLQLSPSIVHRNLVFEVGEPNTIYALGAAARIRITPRVSLNGEYYFQFNAPDESPMRNALAIGFDIETGGHVFQLHLTNSRAMIEKGFITQTTGDFFDGDIHFGFNISRVFQLYE